MELLNHNFVYAENRKPELNGFQYGFWKCDKCNLIMVRVPSDNNTTGDCYYAGESRYINKILDITCDEVIIKKLLE